MYVVGYDNIPGVNDYEWRIEKRNIATGASIWNATDNPRSTGWTGGVDDSAWGAAVDSSGLYIAGWDYVSLYCCSTEWRIEKRDLSTGSLITTFGTGGVIQEDNSDAE